MRQGEHVILSMPKLPLHFCAHWHLIISIITEGQLSVYLRLLDIPLPASLWTINR